MITARHIGAAIRTVGTGVASLWEDGLLVSGAVLIAYGAYEVYRPAGPIVGGILLIAGVILRARGNG